MSEYNNWKKGVDVSSYQGKIDWDKVKKDGVEFAIIRIITSKGKDSQAERNMTECDRLGIPWGVYTYSYARNISQAADEARRTMEALGGRVPRLGIWYDIEWDWQYKNLNKLYMENIVNMFFIHTMENCLQGVYCNKTFYKKYFNDSDRYIWIADYNIPSSFSYNDHIVAQQYSSKGKVNGISGNVDMDKADLGYLLAVVTEEYRCPYNEPTDDFSIVDHTVWDALWLKWHLNKLGYDCYINRVFGETTDQQLRHFQHSMGISYEDDGTVDDYTRKLLIEKVKEGYKCQ